MTEYSQTAALICTNRDVGNALANLATSFPEDTGAELGTFVDSRMLSPDAWYAVVPCKPAFGGVCQAISDDAAYNDERLAYLRERGVTTEQWAAAKSIMQAAVFDRATYSQADLEAFVAANGYTIVEPVEEQP